METKEEIRQSAGSAYYPVTLSDVVKYIMENPGNYALTSLPCFAKALRLSAEKIPVLKKRIKFILGLVCGQLKSSFYTKYIASLAGLDEPLKSCFFREKTTNQPASNYAFFCEGVSGKTARKRLHEGVGAVWMARWFTPLACNYCDDIFAETSDAVLMDAWLPQYRNDPAGTSLVLVRHPEILSIIQAAEKNELDLEPIPVGDLIRSQAGVIRIKRRQLSYRLSKETASRNIPDKRVAACSLPWSFFEKKEIDILEKMQMISRESVPEAQRNEITYEDIGLRLEPYTRKLRKVRRIKAFVNLPARVIRKIGRIIKRG